ncbi:hypothetical protein [Rhodoferax ferrireducens]|uniref:hypothetical protein n=1 Tax=Rhodoferax ferrireducens TaxID=192843 RepID=UPI000E0D2866|nr:hypothetical protein [Rhodoferax ferrireducens]
MTDIKNTPISHLLGQVYESAPPAERSHLLEHLLRPLSLLSLAAVADGIFADMRFRGGWPDQIQLEDAQSVHVSHVVALVDYVQQVNIESINTLTRMLMPSPLMASSAAAALMVGVLMQRVQAHRACGDYQGPEASPTPT